MALCRFGHGVLVAAEHHRRRGELAKPRGQVATRAEGPAAEAMRKGGARLAEQGPEAFARERAPQLLSPGADAALIEEVAQIMAEATRLPGYEYAAAAIADMDRKCHWAQRH